jgi:tRNA(Arg) A34 adenosine deaminase TadA
MQIKGSDIRWLRLAILQAEQAPHAQWRVGAVLVRGGSVLSSGFNRYRNDPSLVELDGVSYHAEEAAIRRAGDPDGATLYVARIKRDGDLGMAKPCQKCQQIILDTGVHTVVWSTSEGLSKERTPALCADRLAV